MEHKKKIILDRELKTDLNSKIYEQGEIYIFYDETKSPKTLNKIANDRILFIPTPTKNKKLDIKYILTCLYEYNIMSVLVY